MIAPIFSNLGALDNGYLVGVTTPMAITSAKSLHLGWMSSDGLKKLLNL